MEHRGTLDSTACARLSWLPRSPLCSIRASRTSSPRISTPPMDMPPVILGCPHSGQGYHGQNQ